MITIDEAQQLLNKAAEQELQAIEFAIKSQCLKQQRQLAWFNISQEAADELKKQGFTLKFNEKEDVPKNYVKIYW